MRAAFFVTAPQYLCWDDSVLALQNIGVTVPLSFVCGRGHVCCWWMWLRTVVASTCSWPSHAFVCAHKAFRNNLIRSGSNAELTVVESVFEMADFPDVAKPLFIGIWWSCPCWSVLGCTRKKCYREGGYCYQRISHLDAILVLNQWNLTLCSLYKGCFCAGAQSLSSSFTSCFYDIDCMHFISPTGSCWARRASKLSNKLLVLKDFQAIFSEKTLLVLCK